MYNFSGLIFRIWGVDGIMLLLGVVLLLFERPWRKSFRLKKCKFALACIAFAICSGLFTTSRIISPDISSYTGEFVDTHRNSRVAPPLPVTSEYVFWNGEGKKVKYYLDVFSKKQVFPCDLVIGEEYTVYFDTETKIIVKIEIVEKDP